MKRKILTLSLVISLVLVGGCGKDEVVEESNAEAPIGEEVVQNDRLYDLKPVEYINEEAEAVIVVEEHLELGDIEVDTSSDENATKSNRSTGIINDKVSSDIDEFINNISMPEEYVMTIDLGVPGMGIIIGEANGYKVSGTELCFMWESENGTFYSDGLEVKSVNVNGRSELFSDKNKEDNTDSSNLGYDSSVADNLFKDTDNVVYIGINEFDGETCYAFKLAVNDDDMLSGEGTLYINCNTGAIEGMTVEQDGSTITIKISNYNDFIGDLENNVSGSIEDSEACNNVEMGLLGAIFSLMSVGMEDSMIIE